MGSSASVASGCVSINNTESCMLGSCLGSKFNSTKQKDWIPLCQCFGNQNLNLAQEASDWVCDLPVHGRRLLFALSCS